MNTPWPMFVSAKALILRTSGSSSPVMYMVMSSPIESPRSLPSLRLMHTPSPGMAISV